MLREVAMDANDQIFRVRQELAARGTERSGGTAGTIGTLVRGR